MLELICSECKNAFPAKEVNVDHIDAVIPFDKTIHDMDYNEIVKRMFYYWWKKEL